MGSLYPEKLIGDLRVQGPLAKPWRDTFLLFISVGSERTELFKSLVATSTAAGAAIVPPRDGIKFMTTIMRVPAPGTAQPSQLTSTDLLQRLTTNAYFVAPLRSRSTDLRAERVSIGRARTSDLVLRDESISKLHAWFEVHDDGSYWLSDANSTNHTTVNGVKLKPQMPVLVLEGSEIRFGSIVCVLAGAAMAFDVATRARKSV